MAIVKRKHGRAYLYRVQRAGVDVIRSYVGPLDDGGVAVLHQTDQLAHAEQAAADAATCADLDEYAKLEPAIRLMATKLSRLVWRCRDRQRRGVDSGRQHATKDATMRKSKTDSPEQTTITRDEFEQLAARAAAGSDEALEDFRDVLRRNPDVHRLLGDLGQHSQRRLIDLIAGGLLVVRETVKQRAEEIRRDLLADGNTPLEQLAVDQVITCWLDVNVQQIGLSRDHSKETVRQRWEQRLDRAQRRHLAAVTALAEVRSHLRSE